MRTWIFSIILIQALASSAFAFGPHQNPGPSPTPSPTPSPSPVPSSSLICAYNAINNASIDAQPLLAACLAAIDQDVGGTLYLGAGTYYLGSPLILNPGTGTRHNLTIQTFNVTPGEPTCLTAGAPGCARLKAMSNFVANEQQATGAVVFSGDELDNLTLDHIVIDGNRAWRSGTPLYQNCLAQDPVRGFNVSMNYIASSMINGIASVNALCGTSFGINSSNTTIQASLFQNNGQTGTSGLFSDGVTTGNSDGLVIQNNIFSNNSDVALVLGPLWTTTNPPGSIVGNTFLQKGSNTSYAEIMLNNWSGPNGANAEFGGMIVNQNSVDCSPSYNCNVGIMVGGRMWLPTAGLVLNATVENNTVNMAKQGVFVYGAGNAAEPIHITGNTISHSGGWEKNQNGTTYVTSEFDVEADSVVTLAGNNIEPVYGLLKGCDEAGTWVMQGTSGGLGCTNEAYASSRTPASKDLSSGVLEFLFPIGLAWGIRTSARRKKKH